MWKVLIEVLMDLIWVTKNSSLFAQKYEKMSVRDKFILKNRLTEAKYSMGNEGTTEVSIERFPKLNHFKHPNYCF